MSRVVILCPAHTVTGGPELLHQFACELVKNNVKASVLYYPYGEHKTPDAYSKYNVDIVDFDAVKNIDCVLIFPEVVTNLVYDFQSREKYIWWLSVDNHFKAYPKGRLEKLKFKVKATLNKKSAPIPMSKMKYYKHLSQSEYGLQFLRQYDVLDAFKLTDYLNEVHLSKQVDIKGKENIVAYNPKKGVSFTQAVIQANSTIQFVPIQDMTAVQVGELLNRSKVYIDFGEHPGKDRIPREAAMARCVVITGMRGSASNSIDLPIDNKFKFDETESSIRAIGALIKDVFVDFDSNISEFEHYIEIIQSEKAEFIQQTKDFIELISNK